MEYLEKEISKNATPENRVEAGMTPVETSFASLNKRGTEAEI